MAQNTEDSVEQGRLLHLWYNSTQLYMFSVRMHATRSTHTHTYQCITVILGHTTQYTCCPKLPNIGGIHQHLPLPSRESYHPVCVCEAAPVQVPPATLHITTHSTMPSHGEARSNRQVTSSISTQFSYLGNTCRPLDYQNTKRKRVVSIQERVYIASPWRSIMSSSDPWGNDYTSQGTFMARQCEPQ